jgi:mRNA-degrading endonuclease RelE of RelBE toxin-antitoxin system
MRFRLLYSAEALADLRAMRSFDRSAVLDHIERRLGLELTKVSRGAVKRLRQPAPAEYRLRVGEFRVFYVVRGEAVMVRRILSKRESLKYLGEAS